VGFPAAGGKKIEGPIDSSHKAVKASANKDGCFQC